MKSLPLLGVLVMVAGLVLRLHPMRVVVAAALTAGLCAHKSLLELLSLIGAAFLKNRFLFLFVLTLPVVGLLEEAGIRTRAAALLQRLSSVTAGRLLFAYQLLRQATAGLGLTSIGGHAQTVRPLLAPMAVAAAERMQPQLSDRARQRILALCAATDNLALFFGEDLFVAFGAVLLTQGVFRQQGILVEPLRVALWGLPTAGLCLLVQLIRLRRLDARLRDGKEP
jgi:uncharacterized membrane protein